MEQPISIKVTRIINALMEKKIRGKATINLEFSGNGDEPKLSMGLEKICEDSPLMEMLLTGHKLPISMEKN